MPFGMASFVLLFSWGVCAFSGRFLGPLVLLIFLAAQIHTARHHHHLSDERGLYAKPDGRLAGDNHCGITQNTRT